MNACGRVIVVVIELSLGRSSMRNRTLAPYLVVLSVLPSACGGGGTTGGDRPKEGSGGSAGSGAVTTGGISGTNLVGSGGSGVTVSTKSTCDPKVSSEGCKLVSSGPACGDGQINQASEECDDGNSLPGDGCSGICLLEPYYTCPTAGQPCVSTILCGDGKVGPGEACDDGNTQDGDGCAAKCNAVEKGFVCRTAGSPCTRVYLCGDGLVDPNEGCDDGNAADGDGCNSRCRIEAGYKCEGSPSHCSSTTCGDGKIEGAESCDDGNVIPFDGCSATC